MVFFLQKKELRLIHLVVIMPVIILLYTGSLQSQVIPTYNIISGDTQSSAGYYFINTMKPGSILPNQFNVMVLDRRGYLVFIKNFNSTVIDFKLQSNRRITYSYSYSGNANMKFFIMDSSLSFVTNTYYRYNTDSHDMQILKTDTTC
jgi:hypothetical protein